jgi:DNA-directed RNA polymerase subunit H
MDDNSKIDVKIKKPIKDKKKSSSKTKKVRKNRRQRRLKDEIKHNLIPIHTVATEQDLAELSLKNITIDKLPLLSISDPAIRHLEIKPGAVIKIKRKNEIIGDIYYYRKVISDE